MAIGSTKAKAQIRFGALRQGRKEAKENNRRATSGDCAALLLALLLVAPLAAAQETDTSSAPPVASQQETVLELAKKTQNPIPSSLKLQFQNYFNPDMGKNDVTQYQNNVVVNYRFHLNHNWNLNTRTALPFTNQPATVPGGESSFGVGDLNPTFYLVPHLRPRKFGTLTVGFGPSFNVPTETAKVLGTGKWAAGPAAVMVTTTRHWVAGVRLNNLWSFAGWGPKDTNQLWLQLVAHYNIRNGWYLATLPTYTANWKAMSGNVWTAPVGGGVGKHFRPNSHGTSLDLQVQSFDNAVKPKGASPWQALVQLQVLFGNEK